MDAGADGHAAPCIVKRELHFLRGVMEITIAPPWRLICVKSNEPAVVWSLTIHRLGYAAR
jgi:hypothetical protein